MSSFVSLTVGKEFLAHLIGESSRAFSGHRPGARGKTATPARTVKKPADVERTAKVAPPDEYRAYLERMAAHHPDPAVRLRAEAVLEKHVEAVLEKRAKAST